MTKDDFTKEYCEAQVKQYGSITKAAEAFTGLVCKPGSPTECVSWRSIERWISQALNQGAVPSVGDIELLSGPGRITRTTETTSEVVRLDANREPKLFTLTRRTVSKVPDVQAPPLVGQSGATTISYNPAPYILRPVLYSVVVSDVQYGFLRDQLTKKLEPIHDPRALGVAKQLVAAIRPTGLYFIGDWMDWPTFSRWQKYPEFYGTMQESIDGGHRELGEFISAAGHQCSKRVMVPSNHQQRPEKFLLEHNMEALSIRRAQSAPSGWPVLSEQYLLRYDDLGISFNGQYPGGEHWLNEQIVLTHAPANRLEFAADNIHGHTHKLDSTVWTQYTSTGRRNYYQYDCGCLCQLTQNTNSQSLLSTRVPSDRGRVLGWAQGIAVVSHLDGKIPKHQIDLVKIDDGSALFHGDYYEAT